MLMLIEILRNINRLKSVNLNTSYVNVNPRVKADGTQFDTYLNTSYVNVNLCY